QGAEPFALSLEPHDVPVVHLPGAKIRVPLGSFGEGHSPLHPPTEVRLLDISLDDEAGLLVPVPEGQSTFIMPIFGTTVIEGQAFDANAPRLPVFPAQATSREISLRAKDGNTKV